MSGTGLIHRLAGSLPATILVVLALTALAIGSGVLFRLTIGGSIALYFVVWWTMLFAILPIRARSQAEAGAVAAGSDPGAPADPALKEKAIWTTIASCAVFILIAIFFPLAGL